MSHRFECPTCQTLLPDEHTVILRLADDLSRDARHRLPAELYAPSATHAALAWCHHCQAVTGVGLRFDRLNRPHLCGTLHTYTEPRVVRKLLARLPRSGAGVRFRSTSRKRPARSGQETAQ